VFNHGKVLPVSLGTITIIHISFFPSVPVLGLKPVYSTAKETGSSLYHWYLLDVCHGVFLESSSRTVRGIRTSAWVISNAVIEVQNSPTSSKSMEQNDREIRHTHEEFRLERVTSHSISIAADTISARKK